MTPPRAGVLTLRVATGPEDVVGARSGRLPLRDADAVVLGGHGFRAASG